MEDVPVPQEEIPMEEVSVLQKKTDIEVDEDSFESSDDEFGEPDFDVPPPVREKSVRELMEEVKDNPMVQEAIDLFGGKLTDVYVNN